MIVAFFSLYLSALKQYEEKRNSGEIWQNNPLSFRLCFSKESIDALFPKITAKEKWNLLNILEPAINNKGELSFIARNRLDLEKEVSSVAPTYVPGFNAQSSANQLEMSTSVVAHKEPKPNAMKFGFNIVIMRKSIYKLYS